MFKNININPISARIKIWVILVLTALFAIIIYIPYNIYNDTQNEVWLQNNASHAARNFLFIILLKTSLVVLIITIAMALLFWYLYKIHKDDILNKELIESENKFRQLVQYASDGIFYNDASGIIKFANPRACEMLGYSPEEINSMSILDTYLPEERETALKRLQIADKGETLKFVRKMVRKDGTAFDAELSVSLLPDGTHQAIIRDISDRLKADEALKESEERFKEIADLLPQTIFESDMKGDLIYANLAGKLIFGYSADYPTSELNINNLLAEKDRPKAKENILELFSGKKGNGNEYTGLRKDGSEIPVVIYTTPIIRKNQLIGLRGLVIDNTERKEFEKQIILAKEKAEEISRLKSNFLATISHELRTPMIGILGFSDILKTELENAELNDMADTIHLSAERLMNTLNHLLDLSGIESNKIETKNEELDIDNKLREIIRSFEGAAKKKGLYISFNPIDKGMNAVLDCRIFQKIMDNLLNNAVKFTESGGITVEVMRGLKENKKCVMINVKDTGIGIEKENHEVIFEEFRQVSEGLGRKYEGTGLGLTITKKSLELMNGEIRVKSEPGIGSTFTIYFAEKEPVI